LASTYSKAAKFPLDAENNNKNNNNNNNIHSDNDDADNDGIKDAADDDDDKVEEGRDDNKSNTNKLKEKQDVVSPSITSSSELIHIQKNQQFLVSQLQEFMIQQQEQNVKVLEALESLQQRLARLEQSIIKQIDHNRGIEPSCNLVRCKETMTAVRFAEFPKWRKQDRAWKMTTLSHRSTKCLKIEVMSQKH
jgi:hypothetical protein